MVDHFYFHSGVFDYSFGESHPLKPERVRRTFRLLDALASVPIADAPLARREDLLRCHDEEFVQAVETLSEAYRNGGELSEEIQELRHEFGFYGDNPPFPGMFEAACGYAGATVKAAEAVRDGAPLAFAIGGGLHHAQRRLASGFCIFDDPAIACDVLLDRFEKVAYVDIDVHHGDGVQWIHYDNPRVLTCSIHEEGKTLYPGTGFADETGVGFSSLNVPIQARTTGDVWLDAFERGILPGLERFAPEAIVLQMGTDPHFLDPLGHLKVSAQEWLAAVRRIKSLGVPIVATGGGGYNLTTVPRMWTAAILTLGGVEFENRIPSELVEPLGVESIFDEELPEPRGVGQEYAEGVVDWLEQHHHPNVGR